MAPKKYISSLFLAGTSATAFQFHGRLNNLAANNAVNAVATTDAGYKACTAVSSVVMSCSAAGSIADSVPEASQAACVCCQGQNELDPVYSSCAAYVKTALQDPSLAAVYDAVFTVCASYECGAAAAPSTTRQPTSVVQPTTTARATITSVPVMPAACSSVVSIADRCEKSGGDDASALVSCLCHDTSGKTNTQVQNWASSCLPWAKTESPNDVSALETFESICTAGLAAESSSLSAKATQSGNGGSSVANRPAFGFPTGSAGGSDDDMTTAPTQTGRTAEETDAPASVSSSRSSAAGVGMGQQQPLGAVAKWVVNGLVAVAGFLVV